MAFTVSEFKSNLKQGGARPSLFSVHLNYPTALTNPAPPSNSEFLIKSTSIPASTIGTHDVYFHGKAFKVAGDRTFDTWDTTIINDEDFGIRIAIENWMNLISDHQLNTRSTGIGLVNHLESENADWKKDIMVTQFGKDGVHKHHYHFLGAFPTAISAIPLDWASQDIEEYTVTWTYDRWMPGTKGGKGAEKSPVHHLFPSDKHNY